MHDADVIGLNRWRKDFKSTLALFSSQIFLGFGIVALSLLFDN